MKIGDIIQFNELAGKKMNPLSQYELVVGRTFLVLREEYMTDSGGYAFYGVEIDCLGFPYIPFPLPRMWSLWNQWLSDKEYEVLRHYTLEVRKA